MNRRFPSEPPTLPFLQRARGGAMDPQRQHRRRRFRRARIAVLLLVLAGVAMWASWTTIRRDLRNRWERPLDVAVVLLRQGDVESEAIAELREELPRLERLFASEFARYHPGRTLAPVVFTAAGPVDIEQSPPNPPEDGKLLSRAAHAWTLGRYFDEIHQRAGISRSGFDARIYVVLRPPTGPLLRFVEGLGAKDGDVGIVRADLERTSIDLTLLAIGHELLHCLGATDKYDEAGRAIEPDGLVEPELRPRHPQRFAEIMVGELPLTPFTGRVPGSLEEVRVGPATAAEIGWWVGDPDELASN